MTDFDAHHEQIHSLLVDAVQHAFDEAFAIKDNDLQRRSRYQLSKNEALKQIEVVCDETVLRLIEAEQKLEELRANLPQHGEAWPAATVLDEEWQA